MPSKCWHCSGDGTEGCRGQNWLLRENCEPAAGAALQKLSQSFWPLSDPFPHSAVLLLRCVSLCCSWRSGGVGNDSGCSAPCPLQKGGKDTLRPTPAANFHTLRMGAMKTETPVRMKTTRPVNLCSLWATVQTSQEYSGSPRHPQPPSACVGSSLSPGATAVGRRGAGVP